jgi:hypothetical protein
MLPLPLECPEQEFGRLCRVFEFHWPSVHLRNSQQHELQMESNS